MEKTDDTRNDYLYREYNHLRNKCDSYIKSSFNDFKLLGAAGLIFAWKPIAENIKGTNNDILFLGFLALLSVISIIGVRDLLKQSIIIYYMKELRAIEKELCKEFNHDGECFKFARNWVGWSNSKHRFIGKIYYIYFFLFIVAYPTFVLFLQSPKQANVYFIVSCVISTISLVAFQRLYSEKALET